MPVSPDHSGRRLVGTAVREVRRQQGEGIEVERQEANVYEQDGELYIDASNPGELSENERVTQSWLTTEGQNTYSGFTGQTQALPDGTHALMMIVDGQQQPLSVFGDSGWVMSSGEYAESPADLAAVANSLLTSERPALGRPEVAAFIEYAAAQVPEVAPLMAALEGTPEDQLHVFNLFVSGVLPAETLEPLTLFATNRQAAVQGAGGASMDALFHETLNALENRDLLGWDGTGESIAMQALALHRPADFVRLVHNLGLLGSAQTLGGDTLTVRPFDPASVQPATQLPLLRGVLAEPLRQSALRENLHELLSAETNVLDGGEVRNALQTLFGDAFEAHHVGIWPERDRGASMSDIRAAVSAGLPVYAELDGPAQNGLLVVGIDEDTGLVTYSREGLLTTLDLTSFEAALRHYAIPQG